MRKAPFETPEALEALLDREKIEPEVNDRANAAGAPAIRFPLVRFNDIEIDSGQRDIVKGLIPAESMIVVYGPPKCTKSFVIMDMMLHVALDWEYRGRRVQQGPVVYLALEGGKGFKARKEAFRQRKLKDEDPPFFLMAGSVNLVADHRALVTSIAEQHVRPVVVVIDTLNRSLVGSESNDEDMAKYIRAADAIRDGFSCAVIIIHHSGLEKGRPRGHTGLTGATDVLIKVEKDTDGNSIMTLELMKDGAEDGNPIVSRLEQVVVGTNVDGDEITSCIVVPVEGVVIRPPVVKAPTLTKGARTGLKALIKALNEAGEPAPPSNHIPPGVRVVTTEQWRALAYKMGISNSTEPRARQVAFTRAFDHLVGSGSVAVWEDIVWLTR